MQVSFQIDQFGRLTCDLSDSSADAIVTASNMPDAGNQLATAVHSAIETGFGECFWEEVCGEYRWVFRREQDRMRVAVLWSTGTVTGWEHVFWSECGVATFASAFTGALQRLQ